MPINSFKHGSWISLTILVCIAYLDFSGAVGSFDFAYLGGDVHMVLTRAYVESHPEIFAKDYLFNDPQNYGHYYNAQVALFTASDHFSSPYGLLFHALVKGISSLIFLVGFFWLGKNVLKSNLLSLCFSLSCAIVVQTISGDYWGIFSIPQARLLFSAVFPFLIIFAMQGPTKWQTWIYAMGLAGIAHWLHPASGPPVALALMLTMFSQAWAVMSKPRLFLYSISSGILFLLIITPNLFSYLSVVISAPEGANQEVVQSVREMRLRKVYLDSVAGIKNFFSNTFDGLRVILPLIAFGGITTIPFYKERTKAKFITIFLSFLLLLSTGIPILEQQMSAYLGKQPSQLDIIRSLRYTVPLFLLLCFIGISVFKFQNAIYRNLLGLAFTLIWSVAQVLPTHSYSNPAFIQGVKCLAKLEILCSQASNQPLDELINFVAYSIPAEARIFAPELGTMLRVAAKKPLVFNWKDVGWLAYSNHLQLEKSFEVAKHFIETQAELNARVRAVEWQKLAASLDADYLVLKSQSVKSDWIKPNKIVFENEYAIIISGK